jgi:acetyl esterase/lipase
LHDNSFQGLDGFEGIHPDLRRVAGFLPRTGVSAKTLRLIRALESLPLPLMSAKDVDVLTLPSGREVRLHRPSGAAERGAPGAAMLWIHGGGYVIGRPSQSDDLCQRFARRLGITVAAPAYRLAPEHPYPAGLEDCYAALRWLASLPSVEPTRVAIGGESGGGGLAAALAFIARDRGEVSPALQLLSYPMLDDRAVASGAAARSYRMWNERSNRFAWASYLGDADPSVAVPARRDDLAGLPPAWIGIGTADLLYDQDVAYAERLLSAGVPCHLEVVPGAFHVFDRIAARAPVSRAYFDSQCSAVRTALRLGRRSNETCD